MKLFNLLEQLDAVELRLADDKLSFDQRVKQVEAHLQLVCELRRELLQPQPLPVYTVGENLEIKPFK